MLEWISQNKDWLFEGLGVATPIAVIGGLFALWKLRKNKRKEAVTEGPPPGLTQSSGDKSTNYQAGRDMVIGQQDSSARKRNSDDESDTERQ
jgi:hypothetical protein